MISLLHYAIGRDIHVGDTIVGTKGRVGFEAAAALITVKAHHLLEKHTLTKWQLQHKEYLSSFYGMHLHEGQYLDPVMRDTEAFLQSSQKMVSGNVVVTLKPYHFSLDGIVSDHDLMSSAFSTYGEENKAWTADDAKGFIKILGNQNKIYQTSKFLIMLQVGIIGGAGYTAGELIRLLLNHPETNINFVYSTSNAGNKLYKVHQDLVGLQN